MSDPLFTSLLTAYLVGVFIALGFSVKYIFMLMSGGVPNAISIYEHLFAGILSAVFLLITPIFSWLAVGYIWASFHEIKCDQNKALADELMKCLQERDMQHTKL